MSSRLRSILKARRVRPILAGLFAILGFGGLNTPPADAQENLIVPPVPDDRVSEFGGRYDALRAVFSSRGLRLGTTGDFIGSAPDNPNDWFLVVLGDPTPLANLVDSGVDLHQFVSNGGSILVATDQPTQTLEQDFSLAVEAGPVETNVLDSAYRNLTYCPVVREFSTGNPLVRGVRELILNHPGWLRGVNAENWSIARLPGGSYAPANGDADVSGKPVVAAAQLDAGRLVVIADQSLFANEMILESDAANLRFGVRIVDWLGGENRSRRVVFIENGQEIDQWIDPRFQSGEWREAVPEIDLIALANQLLSAIEDEHRESNWLNRQLLGWQTRLDPAALASIIILLPLALIALLLLWWLARTRGPIRVEEEAAGPEAAAGSLVGRRWAEQIEKNRFDETARHLAQAAFLRLNERIDFSAPMPEIAIQGNWWMRRRRRKQLVELWNLAAGKKSRTWTARRLRKLERRVRALEPHISANSAMD